MLVQFYNAKGSEESTQFLVGEKDLSSHKPPGKDTCKFETLPGFYTLLSIE